MTTIPNPIQAFVDCTNAGDAEGFVACFTQDASLTDWGRHYAGHSGIADWDRTDNIGVQSHMKVLACHPSGRGYLARIRVSGNGFNGVGNIEFVLEGDKISEVLIG